MRGYICSVCHGMCDAGELEGGVCTECREAEGRKKLESKIVQIACGIVEQEDGQLLLKECV